MQLHPGVIFRILMVCHYVSTFTKNPPVIILPIRKNAVSRS